MSISRTDRITAILTTTAVAIVVAIVACPGHHKSKPVQAALQSVAVTPTNPTIALGTAQQFTATGTYSDGTTKDLTALALWTSSEATAGDLSATSPGQATALGMGSTTITATYSGKSGSTTLTVSSAELVSIEVTPTNPSIALGTSGQFAATGVFTDGTTQDLTAQVLWESSATGTSTISNDAGSQGLALSVGLGDTTITASLASVSGSTQLTVTSAVLVSLEITPTNPSIALGTSQQFAATGTFTDGTTQDLTAEVQWDSSATAASTISNDAGS
jgi:energy-converting hydrogenase Eha subunit A